MSTIVVPVVKSAAGRRAFDIAKKKAIEEGATLVLVGTAKIDERLGENVEALRKHIEELEKELATEGIEYRSEWSVGEPLSRATLDEVRDNGADLIVLGLRKRSPVGKALLGSFEQEILLDAPCPVLSVGTPLV